MDSNHRSLDYRSSALPAKLQQPNSSFLWCWCKDSNLDRAPIQGLQGISLPHCQLCYTSQSGPGDWIQTSDLGVRTAPLFSLSYARSKSGTAGGTLTPYLRVRSAALYTSKLQRPKLRAPGRIRTSNSRLKRPARWPFRHESKSLATLWVPP